jgi:uncharacterized tellurite resistance protein B-like protein
MVGCATGPCVKTLGSFAARAVAGDTSMLDKIRAFLSAEPTDDHVDEAALHLAAAALLIEVAKSDHTLDQDEVARMKAVLANSWGLGEKDLADLVAVAEDASETSVSLHQQIDLINRNFSPRQKIELVRGLWEVACADQHIHHHEEALIRRLADLLYVSHSDFIRSKHQALGER